MKRFLFVWERIFGDRDQKIALIEGY
jgi:hypothetical protein